MDPLVALRESLQSLKQRLARGEIDRAEYQAQRELLLEGLAPDERAALGAPSTPHPVTGLSPRPGTPTPVGPAGARGGGLRTARASLADLELEAGSVLLGQWRLVRELGRGGFGAVFEAEELSLGERHAVKVLDPAMVAKEDLLARFRREVSLMRKLVHPRIVRVYDYREDLSQNLALISMELVAEGSVKQLLTEAKRRDQPIPLPLALNILGEILEALAEAHGQGVIHRDVTPGNVLLAGGTAEQLLQDPERDPRVKLVDFGIAGLVERTELSAKSRVLGTAAYVAPEVLDPSVDVTPQADVYGAGAIGYELVTGHLPVGRFDEPIELRPELGRELNRYLLNLLSSRPEARPGAKVAAWGLRELREETAKRRAQEAQAKAREREEARQRQLEQERQRREAEQRRLDAQRRAEAVAERQRQESALKERQEAERRAIAAEHQRQAEQARLAEEARRMREAPPTPVLVHPFMGAPVQKLARRAPSPLAWLGIVALMVAVVGGIGWGVQQQKAAERRRVMAEQQRQAAIAEEQRKAQEASTLNAEARTRLVAGDLNGALAANERALLAEPGGGEALALREEIEARSREVKAAEQANFELALVAARKAYLERRYSEAILAAEKALSIKAGNDEALRIISDSEHSRRRIRERQQAIDGGQKTPDTPPIASPQLSEPTMSTVTPAEAALEIDFTSEISEGLLTVYVAERQIFREPFRFVRRTGFLAREKIGGAIRATRRIQAGAVQIRIYVALADKATKAAALEGDMRGGETRRLVIRVDAGGDVVCSLAETE